MEEIRDYYAFLGVPRNATADEIKRAYARKRREYQNDETKSTQLNQAYEVLCDSAKRKQYDLNMQYGNQVEDIKEKIQNSETLEQRDKYLVDAKKIYLDILKNDAENADALWNMVGIEELLGNDTQAIQYLKQLEKCVEGDDKLQVYHRLGEIYRRLGKVDEAIKCYHAIYKADAAYVEDIKILVRLCYEDKKNLKVAIQILNDCINRSTDSRLKIVYLYETLRAIRLLKVSSYQKVEDTLYKKLETFHTDNEESNLANAATILTCFEDVLDREDFECFHRMEQIYLLYGVKHPELNQAFRAVQQIVPLMEKGKLHKAIELYLEEQWTKEIREQIGRLIIKEAEQIKASLESIKKEAPEYWKSENELVDLEKLVNENLKASKEFNSLSNDRTISYYMKKMIECILLDGFVAFEDIKDEFIEARDSFFEREDRGKYQHTLKKMQEYYPLCYTLFADIFFTEAPVEKSNGNNTISERGHNTNSNASPTVYYPDANEEYIHRPYLSGLLELIFIIIGTCCFPPILPIVLITKYYHRHEKAVKRFLKKLLILGIVALIIAVIGAVIYFVIESKEKQYEEAHNGWLTDKELEKADDLSAEYSKKTDIDIRYIQREEGDKSQIAYEGPYIYLVYSSMGFSFELGSHTLYSNCLTEGENEQLADMLWAMVEDEELSDMEICEQFFEITYDFINEREMSYEQDVNSDERQNNETKDNGEAGNHQENDATYFKIEIMDYYNLNAYEFAEQFDMQIQEGVGGCNGFGISEYLYRRGQWADFYTISLHARSDFTDIAGAFQTSIISDKYSLFGIYVGMEFSECVEVLGQQGFILDETETWNVDESYYYYFNNSQGERIQVNIYENTCDGIDFWPAIYFN